MIIGPGSAAFEIMRDFVYNLPILITPKWVDSKANPIALENLNHYLLSFADEEVTESDFFEVGGLMCLVIESSLKSSLRQPTTAIDYFQPAYLPHLWPPFGLG